MDETQVYSYPLLLSPCYRAPRRHKGESRFPRRFVVTLASGAAASVGGGGERDESTVDLFFPCNLV